MSMTSTSRLYHCTYCHDRVVICSRCDRGNIYCPECSNIAPKESKKRSAKRYQSSRKGRLKNAERQRRFREKKRLTLEIKKPSDKKVTHQGSPPESTNVSLPSEQLQRQDNQKTVIRSAKEGIYCLFCGYECSNYLRSRFSCRKQ